MDILKIHKDALVFQTTTDTFEVTTMSSIGPFIYTWVVNPYWAKEGSTLL